MSLSTPIDSPHKSSTCKLSCDFEILRNSQIFRSTNSDVVKLFAYLAKRKKYLIGDQIITSEKEAQHAFLLLSGHVEILTNHKGSEVVVQNLTENAFFGELALLASFNWFFTARATTNCEVLSVSREAFEKVLEKHPEKRQRMTERIIQLRIERLNEQTAHMLEMIPEGEFDRNKMFSPAIT